ncbi:MAG: hypothetical protein ACOX26_01190 [Bacilli bacterium]|jgi:cytoskeletal protein RodZ
MKNKRIRSKSILALLTLALAVGFVGLNNKTNFKVDAANPAPITLNFDSNAQITTLIIIALAGILTLAGYILLRKRYRLIK